MKLVLALALALSALTACKKTDGAASVKDGDDETSGAETNNAVTEAGAADPVAAIPLEKFKASCEKCHGPSQNVSLFPTVYVDDKDGAWRKNIAKMPSRIARVLDWETNDEHKKRDPQLASLSNADRLAMKAAMDALVAPELRAIPLASFRQHCPACHEGGGTDFMKVYGDDPDLIQRQGIAQFAAAIAVKLDWANLREGNRPMPPSEAKRKELDDETRKAMLDALAPFKTKPYTRP
jgi:mono/diheme cytochrome c family protein